MRKLLFVIASMLFTMNAMAQVTYFEGNLNEAIAKAKAESKIVMVMASTTWCGPCKKVEKEFLSTKELGDYFSGTIVFKKYLLDLADPDSITDKYKVSVYPTFIYIDGNGDEITRSTGGAENLAAFIEKIKTAIAPENRLSAQEEKFKKDPSYAMGYINFLTKARLTDKIQDVLMEMVKFRPAEVIFTPEWVEYYKKNIPSVTNPFIREMLVNNKYVIQVMGEENYRDFLLEKSVASISKELYSPKFDEKRFDELLQFVKSNKLLKNSFYQFVVKNKELLQIKDLKAIMPIVDKNLEKADSYSRRAMLAVLVECMPKNGIAEYKTEVIRLHEKALRQETSEKLKEGYRKTINQLSSGETKKTARMN